MLTAWLAPTFVFAAWWNPLSWYIFSSQSQPSATSSEDKIFFNQTYTYYLTQNANVRECKFSSCKVLKVEIQGTPVEFSGSTGYSTISKLPEWVGYAWTENEVSKTGYINKSLFSEKPVVRQEGAPNLSELLRTATPVNDDALKKQNDETVAKLNQMLDEMRQQLEKSNPLSSQQTYPNTSIASELIKSMQDSKTQVAEYQKKIESESATTTQLRLLDYFTTNDLMRTDGQTCAPAYEMRNTDVKKAVKIILQYCMKTTGGLNTVNYTSDIDKLQCNMQYDPISGWMKLMNCREGIF